MSINLRSDFTLKSIAGKLCSIGGMSIPILSEPTRHLLVDEALTYTYQPRPQVYGRAQVKQEVAAVTDIPTHSAFFNLRDEWQKLFAHKLEQSPWAKLFFPTPLNLNTVALQRYEAGSIGIGPHRDSASFVNLICIFILTGHSRFIICSDHQGNNPVELDSSPGQVILLRAPGFMTRKIQPIHAISDIPETRITFTLRQTSQP